MAYTSFFFADINNLLAFCPAAFSAVYLCVPLDTDLPGAQDILQELGVVSLLSMFILSILKVPTYAGILGNIR